MQLTKEYLTGRGWKESSNAVTKDYRDADGRKYRVGWNTETHVLYLGYGQMPFPVETAENLKAILGAAGLEEITDVAAYLRTMQSLRDLADSVYPDKFRLICTQQGIKEYRAMEMYAFFQSIVKGHTPYKDGRPLTDEQMEEIVSLAREADGMYREFGRKIPTVKLKEGRYGDSLNHVLVVWAPKDGGEDQQTELDLSCQDAYVTIGRIADGGNAIKAILRQADRITSTNACVSLGSDRRGKDSLNVYEGDVFLAYLDRPGFWSSDAKDCGLYLCANGSYRKLLYTEGKGYVRGGIPDCDGDFKVDIQEGAFNSHILTMSQKWKKIGNVHVDVGFLIENNKDIDNTKK